MVSINYAFREISCKIVFYGPGMSGKTTNLQFIHDKAPKDATGELISLATDADRTLYFDFLPLDLGQIQGFTTKFQLYTVPGQVYYNATRKLVLRGVDGIVFVADSQRDKMAENVESLNNLKENLAEYGYDLTQIPWVIQYNKRDLPNVATLAELEAALNPDNVPYFEAVATTGIGVFDTLKYIAKVVLDRARRRPGEPVAAVPAPARAAASPAAVRPEPQRPAEPPRVPEPAVPYRPGAVPLREEGVPTASTPVPPPPPPRPVPRPAGGFSGEKVRPAIAPPPPIHELKPVQRMAPPERMVGKPAGKPEEKEDDKKKSFFSRLFKSQK